MTEDQFITKMAPLCKCCEECSQVVCAGVLAGGFCDRICHGHDEDDERNYHDVEDD